MSQIKPTSAAKIAAAIVIDLESRTGFKQLFQEISAGVKNEIQEKITTLIVDERENPSGEAPQQQQQQKTQQNNTATKEQLIADFSQLNAKELKHTKANMERALNNQPDRADAKLALEAINEVIAKAKPEGAA